MFMKLRKYWLPFSVVLVVFVSLSIYLLTETQGRKGQAHPTDTEKSSLGHISQDGDSHDGELHAEAQAENDANVEERDTPTRPTTGNAISSNPLFADGVPEHLQCPAKWVGAYQSEVPEEALILAVDIAAEVIDKYNPNRPLPDIWPRYIEAELDYLTNAEPEKRNYASGANRLDWAIQLILDFPEIMILSLEDGARLADMCMIDMGIREPDWNVWQLSDGRTLRAKDGYYYHVITRSSDGEVKSRRSFGHSGKDAKGVVIDLDKTSDEELERLGGWNFNINPYTTGLYKLGDKPRDEMKYVK